MNIQRLPIVDRKLWREWRSHDVTASNMGALFSCHPYVTALRLYAEKRGTEFPEPDEDNKILRRGRWLEPSVALAVHELRPHWEVIRAEHYLRSPELKIGATPDYYINHNSRRGVLQIKTAAPHIYERDWQNGEEPPLWVLLQASTEMMLDGADFAAVAVMLIDAFNLDVAVVEFERSAAVEEKIIRAVGEFWQMVANAREPEPDFGRDRDVIRALHPQATPGSCVDLRGRNDVPMLLAERADLLEQEKGIEARCAAIESEMAHLIGDAETARADGFTMTYKNVHVNGYTVKPRDSRQLRIYDRREKP